MEKTTINGPPQGTKRLMEVEDQSMSLGCHDRQRIRTEEPPFEVDLSAIDAVEGEIASPTGAIGNSNILEALTSRSTAGDVGEDIPAQSQEQQARLVAGQTTYKDIDKDLFRTTFKELHHLAKCMNCSAEIGNFKLNVPASGKAYITCMHVSRNEENNPVQCGELHYPVQFWPMMLRINEATFLERNGPGVTKHLNQSIWQKDKPQTAPIGKTLSLKECRKLVESEAFKNETKNLPTVRTIVSQLLRLVGNGSRVGPATAQPQKAKAAKDKGVGAPESFSEVVKKGRSVKKQIIHQTNLALQAAELNESAQERVAAVNKVIMGINPVTDTPIARAKPVPERMMRNVNDIVNPHLISARDNLEALQFRGMKRTNYSLVRQILKAKEVDLKDIWQMTFTNPTTLELIVHKDKIKEIKEKLLSGFNPEGGIGPKALVEHAYKADGQSAQEELNALKKYIKKAARICAGTRNLGVAVFYQSKIPKEYQEEFIKETKAIYRATGGSGGRPNE